jgi:hypothetical protein
MKILTANSLTTGEVVFWNAGRWSARFGDGQRFDSEDAAAAALSVAEGQPQIAVAAYLIDVEADGDADVEAFKASHSSARSTGRVKLIRR